MTSKKNESIPKTLPSQFWIKAGSLLTDAKSDILTDQFVGIKNGKIEKIVCENAFEKSGSSLCVDATDYIVIPGLINAHTHSAMGFFRGFGSDAPVPGQDQSMIETFLFPAERALTPDLVEKLSYSYIVQGLKSGVTTFFDHYYFIESVGKAFQRIGARAFLAETIADIGGAFPSIDTWNRAKKGIEHWPFDVEKISPMIGPHATDTISPKVFKEISEFARQTKLPVHMHCSQTEGERSRLLKSTKKSPVQFACDMGLLGENTLAVHLVSATQDDLNIIKQSGSTAVYCPTSQVQYEKSADIAAWNQTQLKFAIATDCAASNDANDPLNECKIADVLLRHLSQNKQSLTGEKLLSCIMDIPAAAAGKKDLLGTLRPGAYADCVFVKKGIELAPFDRLKNNLIFSNGSAFVEHVMINGKWVIYNRNLATANEAELVAEYASSVLEIQSLAGLVKS